MSKVYTTNARVVYIRAGVVYSINNALEAYNFEVPVYVFMLSDGHAVCIMLSVPTCVRGGEKKKGRKEKNKLNTSIIFRSEDTYVVYVRYFGPE